ASFSRDWSSDVCSSDLLWYFTNALFFINPLFPSRSPKPALLRLFGARVGRGVVIHPGVNIKFPWKLRIGDHCWIGQRAWLDNLRSEERRAGQARPPRLS